MPRPIIAVDIDDVLADHAKNFTEFSNQRWGTNLDPSDYEEDWAKMWQVDIDEVRRRAEEYFGESRVLSYEHDVHAFDVLKDLQRDFDLIIVTARRMHTKDDTHLWIHEKFPGIFTDETIHLAGIWDRIDQRGLTLTKGGLLKDLGAHYLIDDMMKHCVSAQERGIKAVLFGDYSWNSVADGSLPDGITRAKSWLQVKEYFDRERAK